MTGNSLDIKQSQLEKLKQLFPEAITEGKIDWEKLQASLGKENIEFQNERYVLNWAGKTDAFRVLQQTTTATLKPCPGEGINDGFSSPFGGGQEGASENVFIEGENLEVLKVLQKSYYGKIKCIIIDPPYNTGNDSFIYPDSFKESKEDYQKRIGEKDEEGYLMKEGYFRKNSKDSGHYHSNWLSMMYPRLFLAKNLLRDDGVIFVHIDDNEVHNLRLIMNEIFGEENFVGQISIQSNPRGRQSEKFFATVHDYLIVFAKKIDICSIVGTSLSEEQLEEFKLEDKRGKFRLLGLRQRGAASRRVDRPLMYYPIYVNPKNCKVSLEKDQGYSIEVLPKKSTGEEGRWMWSNKKVISDIDSIEAKLISHRNEYDIFIRDYLEKSGEERSRKANTIWNDKEVNNQNGTIDLKNLFNDIKLFDFPKPIGTIKKILSIVKREETDVILDFFAGSGTTAQAVLELNKEDGGNRKFVLVQLPEKCDEESEACKAGYKTIADISKERIRRVIGKLTSPPTPLQVERGEKNGKYFHNLFMDASPTIFENAHQLRLVDKTEAEEKLWEQLRNRKVENCKFRRQHPLGKFIADFYCHENKLVVEVDGGYHNEKEQQEHDNLRTQVINAFGISVIRFTNDEVLNNIKSVIEKITNALKNYSGTNNIKSSSKTPSPFGEGRGEAGFKVFKLSSSNFKIWRGSEITEENLETQLDAFTNPVREGSEKENMLYELILKAGYLLTDKVEAKEKYYSVNDGELIIALEEMNKDIIEGIIAAKPKKVITLDSSFRGNKADELKTNTVLQMRDAEIDFKTI